MSRMAMSAEGASPRAVGATAGAPSSTPAVSFGVSVSVVLILLYFASLFELPPGLPVARLIVVPSLSVLITREGPVTIS